MRYYFICYVWKNLRDQPYRYENAVIDHSPIEWLAKIRADYEDEKYVLISQQEISKEEFDTYKDLI